MSKKVAIVTGAAMGYKNSGPSIGGAIAIQLAKDGYDVVVIDRLQAGQKTIDIIKSNGGDGIFIKTNIVKTENIKKVIKTIKEKYGRLDCLVNCIAYYSSGMAKSVMDIEEKYWEKTLETNLNGYFKCCKYALPLMLKSDGGSIVNISSGSAFQSLPNFSIYSVTKAGINALTRSLAVDFAPKIRTNSICPGFVRIENSENNRSPKELKEWYADIAKQYPMRRVCEVEEIANVASFLASDKASYVNGQSIVVDGGKMISDAHDF